MSQVTITLFTKNGITINASLSRTSSSSKAIIYLHGGGLIFGQRNDLPKEYIELFNNAGFNFVTIDYPLAPEAKLDQILDSLTKSLNELSHYINTTQMIAMGRSAGSYLWYLLIKNGAAPRAFLDFYGYAKVNNSIFKMPAPYYTKFPLVPPFQAQSLIQKSPLVFGDLDQRYPIYLSSRQLGTWLSAFLPQVNKADQYSVSDSELTKFPPTLLIHCINDPDIPYKLAVETSNIIPKAKLITIDLNEHDFDRIVSCYTLEIYQQAINWLNNAVTFH